MFTIILRQGYKHFVKKVCILLPDCKEFEVIEVDERNLMRLMSANIPYDSKPFFVHTSRLLTQDFCYIYRIMHSA